jgi:hypothetical protein
MSSRSGARQTVRVDATIAIDAVMAADTQLPRPCASGNAGDSPGKLERALLDHRRSSSPTQVQAVSILVFLTRAMVRNNVKPGRIHRILATSRLVS